MDINSKSSFAGGEGVGRIGARGVSRRTFLVGSLAAVASIGTGAFLAGCSSSDSAQSASGSAAASSSSSGSANSVTIGTLATEDILPMWVAQQEGLFDKAGITADVVTFQSATELIAGVSSGSVNLAMTDPMVTASIFASGTDVQMAWVTLGTTAAQGRFGIQTAANSGITSLDQLSGVPIGVGSNTILEYVMDNLMERAGVAENDIVVSELQKLPVRYQAMASGEVKAAALPASLLALGEASGCVTLADDTTGDNISQSVMIVRENFLSQNGGEALLKKVEDIWDEAVGMINANPENYRELLVKNANLSDAVAATYKISEYPTVQLPTNAMVDPVLAWMDHKGYLTVPLTYDGSTGKFTKN